MLARNLSFTNKENLTNNLSSKQSRRLPERSLADHNETGNMLQTAETDMVIETNQFAAWLWLCKNLLKLVRVLLTEFESVSLKSASDNSFKLSVPRSEESTIGSLLSLLQSVKQSLHIDEY